MKLTVDLEQIFSADDYNTTVGTLIREELLKVIRAEVAKHAKNDPGLKRAIDAIKRDATRKILAAYGEAREKP